MIELIFKKIFVKPAKAIANILKESNGNPIQSPEFLEAKRKDPALVYNITKAIEERYNKEANGKPWDWA